MSAAMSGAAPSKYGRNEAKRIYGKKIRTQCGNIARKNFAPRRAYKAAKRGKAINEKTKGVDFMPNLTSKELSALEDQLGAEQLLVKKYQLVSQMTSDPQIRTKCDQIAQKHQEHFNRLMTHLN